MKTAYSYKRFSHRSQGDGDSIRRQTGQTKKWCKDNGYSLSDLSFSDLGISGFRGKNIVKGELNAFLEFAESGRIETKNAVLVVENLDRLSRADFFTAVGLLNRILSTGIGLVSLSTGSVLTKEKATDFDIMGMVFDLMRAHGESKRKSEMISAWWTAKRRQKGSIGAACPAWLDFVGGKYVPNSGQKTVKLIFKLMAEGMGLQQVLRHLNSNKIPNIGRGANGWNSSYVSLILNNRAVLGERQPYKMVNGKRVKEGEPIKDFFPAIIDKGLFYRCQDRLSISRGAFRGRGAKTFTNLFTGLLKDARDGGSLVFCKGTKGNAGKRKEWLFIGSVNAQRRTTDLSYVTFPYRELETALLMQLKELTAEEFFPTSKKDKTELAALEDELAETNTNIRAIQQRMVEGKQFASLVSVLEKLDLKKQELTSALEGMKAKQHRQDDSTLVDMLDLIEQMDHGSDEEKKSIRERLQGRIRSLLSGIWMKIWKERTKEKVWGYPYDRYADIELRFRNGSKRTFKIKDSTARGLEFLK